MDETARPNAPSTIPLVVDLDGTLIRSDSTFESFFSMLKAYPCGLLLCVFWLYKGRAYFKKQISRHVAFDAASQPYNQQVLAFIQEEKAKGRKLILATGAHISIAQAVADHLGVFDEVYATHTDVNFISRNKAALLVEKYGEKGFDYFGNSRADFAVWAVSNEALCVNPSFPVAKAQALNISFSTLIDENLNQPKACLKALRPHQWTKNLIVFTPIIGAHSVNDPTMMLQAIIGFLAFCFCASSAYVLNDLFDLESDRLHKTKKHRPFACGALDNRAAIALSTIPLIISLLLSLCLDFRFLLVMGIYLCITFGYSFYLKQFAIIDILILAALYTIRIIAGAEAIEVPISFWLMAFSMFLFLSLAIIKRHTEMEKSRDQGVHHPRGRGYNIDDTPFLLAMGGASGYISVLVFALYLQTLTGTGMYTTPKYLWFICPILLFWVSRMWLLTHRKQMHEDPIVWALKDWSGLVVVLSSGALIMAAL